MKINDLIQGLTELGQEHLCKYGQNDLFTEAIAAIEEFIVLRKKLDEIYMRIGSLEDRR